MQGRAASFKDLERDLTNLFPAPPTPRPCSLTSNLTSSLRHDLTQDVAVLVNQQQTQLDTIEADVQSASIVVTKGKFAQPRAAAC